MGLVHDVDIVQPLLARLAVAGVLQVVQNVALAVEIVGLVAVLHQAVLGIIHHLGDISGEGGEIHGLLPGQIRRPLHRQGVDGDVLRGQLQQALHRMAEAVQRIGGQSGDDVHIDVVKAQLPGHLIAVHHRLGRMLAAHEAQHIVVEGLGIDADAGDAGLPDHLELFPGDGIRPTGLDGVLPHLREVKVFGHTVGEPLELLGSDGGGGAAAKVDGAQLQPGLPGHFGGVGDLLAQAVDVLIHELVGLFDGMGYKGAVQAPGRTERNGDVQTEAVRGVPGEDGMLLLLGGKGQIQLLLGDQVVLPQFPGNLLPAVPHLGTVPVISLRR